GGGPDDRGARDGRSVPGAPDVCRRAHPAGPMPLAPCADHRDGGAVPRARSGPPHRTRARLVRLPAPTPVHPRASSRGPADDAAAAGALRIGQDAIRRGTAVLTLPPAVAAETAAR